jgi:oxygen-independent coproporphyrinogen-3 oxidase
MTIELVERHARPVPRYTSYPTAPNFSSRIGANDYRTWLANLGGNRRLSLYAHIPFCDELCWYCACTTKASRRYQPVASYLDVLEREIATVGGLVAKDARVGQIHWGGGSPSMLLPKDIVRLSEALRRHFSIAPDAELAVEVDPRGLTDNSIAAFAAAGVTRVSIGVQDFDRRVQAAINRIQTYDETRAVIESFRAHGIRSLNIDLVYGLPLQTTESVACTIGHVLRLRPDRIAIFGYAHVPSRAHHQRLIDASKLPTGAERYALALRICEIVRGAGYRQIGLDHFALPTDALATKPLRRSFQGYTVDDSDALIGLGASAIGLLPEGYVQNAPAVASYSRHIREAGLATVRGFELSVDDRVRAYVIERLMCGADFSRSDLIERFGAAAHPVIAAAETLILHDSDHFLERKADGFRLTERGRTFVRVVCTAFDAYWSEGSVQHALAV